MIDILVVVTARLKSERLPGKVLHLLGGLTALEIQVRRAQAVGLPVVISVPSDEPELIKVAEGIRGPLGVSPGPPADVSNQIYLAAKPYNPKVVIRGLPDCPFFDYAATLRRARMLVKYGAADATRSFHPFGREPFYGADEPAYSWRAVERMAASSNEFEEEHFGSTIDLHRREMNILYTTPPPLTLYRDTARPFRLELDTPEDLAMLSELISQIGRIASLQTAVWYLERHPELVRLNAEVEEKTGPVVSFTKQADEIKASIEAAWDLGDGNRFGLAEGLNPVWCAEDVCFLGYVEPRRDHVLVLVDGTEVKKGKVHCRCGAGREWH